MASATALGFMARLKPNASTNPLLRSRWPVTSDHSGRQQHHGGRVVRCVLATRPTAMPKARRHLPRSHAHCQQCGSKVAGIVRSDSRDAVRPVVLADDGTPDARQKHGRPFRLMDNAGMMFRRIKQPLVKVPVNAGKMNNATRMIAPNRE